MEEIAAKLERTALVRMKISAATVKNSMEISFKIRNKIIICFSSLTTQFRSIYPKDINSLYQRKTWPTMSMIAQFTTDRRDMQCMCI